MAYSLLFNSRLVYYSDADQSADGRRQEQMQNLLESDKGQMLLSGEDFLDQAHCFKDDDRAFIEDVIDRNFESKAFMVNTIRSFIYSSSPDMRPSGLGHLSVETLLSLISSTPANRHSRRSSGGRRSSAAASVEMARFANADGESSFAHAPYVELRG